MIVVLGAFDGFHKGHALLLDRARILAREHPSHSDQDDWAVVTFSPHPDSVVRGNSFPLLFTEEERDLLSRFFLVPNFMKIPFDTSLAMTPPGHFIDLLESLLPVTGIVVGDDFRFGRNREGDATFLQEAARRKGWLFEKVDSLVVDGAKVGSSDIKRLVARGEMLRAKRLLGYPFFFRGRVVSGDGRGRSLGFPTANLRYPLQKTMPKTGVYAASVLVGSQWWPGALNIGYNPTFLSRNDLPRFETYILDFDESLYDRTITVFVESYLRREVKFGTPDELRAQMRRDISRVRTAFGENMLRFEDVYCLLSKAFEPSSSPELEKS
jgi:riboflavin kinase/FMN adenylyltransferase